ncbi:bacillithiol system redox-active protein YtxJ [Ureibacillus aquaedulcis]|uniref:Bacillithiol system redox-active protein YtxJ n=1 Tax=Ureibacillus aquaedulcis TaxID=3058421 RepID=A0ABT8GNP4_9BACL|nr:bacillithiol system redox-active protein YtxJ [Ureibacillus sp. BA0131]MDN4493041.1 bacillithiol system redox-active protein YtxJ [Ureibacillus sp. BA0131]
MKRIPSIEAWRELLDNSKEQPFLLFKFSTTCIISLSAMKELRALETELPQYIVVVQEDRLLSKTIEKDLGVKHESPQLLILKDKKAIWQATHSKVKKSLVNEALRMYL